MESVRVRMGKYEAEAGRFPDVCVRSGEPAYRTVSRRVVDGRALLFAWPLIVIPFGHWIYRSIVRRRQVAFKVPLSRVEAERFDSRRTKHRIALGAFIVLIPCLVAAIVMSYDDGYASRADTATIVAVAVGVALAVAMVGLVLTRDPMGFHLRGEEVRFRAHPAFADALARRPSGTTVAQHFQASPWAPTAIPTSAVPAGWLPDPAGRFVARWWDGNVWTTSVADAAGRQYVDS